MKDGVHVDMRTGAADVELTADVRQRDVLDQSVYAFSRPNLFGIRVYEVLVDILAGLLFSLEPVCHAAAPDQVSLVVGSRYFALTSTASSPRRRCHFHSVRAMGVGLRRSPLACDHFELAL